MKNETTKFCTLKPFMYVDLQKSTFQEMAKDIKKLFEDIILYRKQERIKSYTAFAKAVDLWLPTPCMYSDDNATKIYFASCKPNEEGKAKWNMGNEKYNCLRMFLDNNLKPNQEDVK